MLALNVIGISAVKSGSFNLNTIFRVHHLLTTNLSGQKCLTYFLNPGAKPR